MGLQPFSVNLFGAFVCVGAVEQHDAARERAVGQHAEKVALSATRLVKLIAFCAAPSSAALANATSNAVRSARPLALCSMAGAVGINL